MAQPDVRVVGAFQLAGFSFEKKRDVTGNDVFSVSRSVPAAKSGALTTRTDNDTGTLTMDSGHGFTTGARLDLYWTGGCRRGITIGTVSGDSVPIDLGSGDNLPDDETAIVAMIPLEESFPLTVADANMVSVKCDAEAQFTLCESDDTESYSFHTTPLVASEEQSDFWAEGFGATPLTQTTITKIYLSHADVSAAHDMTAAYKSD